MREEIPSTKPDQVFSVQFLGHETCIHMKKNNLYTDFHYWIIGLQMPLNFNIHLFCWILTLTYEGKTMKQTNKQKRERKLPNPTILYLRVSKSCTERKVISLRRVNLLCNVCDFSSCGGLELTQFSHILWKATFSNTLNVVAKICDKKIRGDSTAGQLNHP